MYCEQCGAELEHDARFCSTCGKPVGDESAQFSLQHVLQTVPRWVGLLRHKWLIAGPLALLILSGALFWMFRSEEVDIANQNTQRNREHTQNIVRNPPSESGDVLDVVNGKSQLSRGSAENFIRNAPEFQALRTIVYFHSEGLKKGVDQKMWIEPGFHAGTLYNGYFVTEKARTIASNVSYSSLGLVTPAEVPSLEITGIADAMSFAGAVPGMKEAEFTWSYGDLPPAIKRFASRGGTGKAHFRLYDDGLAAGRRQLTPVAGTHSLNPRRTVDPSVA